MIDLICPKCYATLPVAENKLGTRVFVCPRCFEPLPLPMPAMAEAVETPDAAPVPAASAAANPHSEDETLAPDQAQAYVQEKLRQIAEKRAAAKASQSGERPKPERPQPRPVAKKSVLPLVLLIGGGVAVVGAGAIVAVVVAFIVMGSGSKPNDPPRGVDHEAAEKKPETPAEIKPLDAKLLTVDALAKAVKEGPADARKQALLELSARGPEAHAALSAVLDALKDPDAATRTAAKNALARLGPPTKADVPVYAAALREQALEQRVYAAGQLAELGLQAKGELLFLRVLALDDNAAVQDAAQKAVRRIEDDLLVSLTKDLQDKSPAVRSKAARELAEMGTGARAALPNLVEALADKNSAVRLDVLAAFLAIGPDAVMVLGESLRDKNPDVRLTAINALGRMGSDARFVMPDLIAVTIGADAKTKEEALQAFARIGDFAIPYLIQALEREKNAARQKPLVEALERMGPSAAPALHAALKKATPEVNKAAAQALVKMEAQPKPPPRKDHAGAAGLIQSELRGWFAAADSDKDGFLDKDELARAIRGPKAKAYDYAPESAAPKEFGPKDFAKFPDYAFLCRVDRDNDGKISRDEFERWAYDYAAVLKKDQDDRDRITQMQQRLMERGLSNKARLDTEAALANLWAAYNNQRSAQSALNRDIDQMQWLQRYAMDRWANYNNQAVAQAGRDVNQMQWLQRWALSRVPRR